MQVVYLQSKLVQGAPALAELEVLPVVDQDLAALGDEGQGPEVDALPLLTLCQLGCVLSGGWQSAPTCSS